MPSGNMNIFFTEKNACCMPVPTIFEMIPDALDSTVFQRWLGMAKQCAEHQDGDLKEHFSWVCCSQLGIDDWNLRPFRFFQLLCGRQSFQMRWLTMEAGWLFACLVSPIYGTLWDHWWYMMIQSTGSDETGLFRLGFILTASVLSSEVVTFYNFALTSCPRSRMNFLWIGSGFQSSEISKKLISLLCFIPRPWCKLEASQWTWWCQEVRHCVYTWEDSGGLQYRQRWDEARMAWDGNGWPKMIK